MRTSEDSRLVGYQDRVTHSVLPLERAFCASCGRPWGWTSQESYAYIAASEITVVCEDCFEHLNPEQKSRRISQAEMALRGLCEEMS